ncbi:hypothetical protein FRC07_004371 [Ceratobasidium sp. 392]|nr:hypothetical protein FRC07_004371 [Ceratobasidium sp. 392]
MDWAHTWSIYLRERYLVPTVTGPITTPNYVQESYPVPIDPALYYAAYNAGFEAGLNQIAQYYAHQLAQGAQTIGGHGYQQPIGTPLAIEGNIGYGGAWNGGQALAVPEQAQVTTYASVAEEMMVKDEAEELVGMDAEEEQQQPQTVAEQATGPGVPPPLPSLAPASGVNLETNVAMGSPVLVPSQMTNAPMHLPVLEPSVNMLAIPSNLIPIQAPVQSLLPFPLDPTPAPAPVPIPPPKSSLRVPVFMDKPDPKERRLYYGVRPPLVPRKPLKKTRTAAPVDDTSHILYYGCMGWWAVLRSVLRKSFPDCKETGFVPKCSVPKKPSSWIPPRLTR